MFRLISLLVVVAILAVLWLTVVSSTAGTGAVHRAGRHHDDVAARADEGARRRRRGTRRLLTGVVDLSTVLAAR